MTDAPGECVRLPLHFRPRHRLTHAREFEAVFAAKVRKVRGPVMIFTMPNELGWPRLGLSIGGRVGNAVRRNTWKRLIREAFRLQQHELARTERGTGYDVVVSIRSSPDQPAWTLQACAKALTELAAEADREWRRRDRRDGPLGSQPPPTPPANNNPA